MKAHYYSDVEPATFLLDNEFDHAFEVDLAHSNALALDDEGRCRDSVHTDDDLDII